MNPAASSSAGAIGLDSFGPGLHLSAMSLRPRTLAAGFIAPCLPTKTHEPPSGRLWIHEIKHDGFRIIARKNGDRVRLSSIAVPAMVHSARKNLNEVRQNPSL